MVLLGNEIKAGAIAYLDAQALNTDARVTKSGDPVTRPGLGNQFVCYKVTNASCFWAPLTATPRAERLRIEPKWVRNGYGPLRDGDVFLQDGKNTYAGPADAFVEAGKKETPFKSARPSLTPAGVVAVVKGRGGQL